MSQMTCPRHTVNPVARLHGQQAGRLSLSGNGGNGLGGAGNKQWPRWSPFVISTGREQGRIPQFTHTRSIIHLIFHSFILSLLSMTYRTRNHTRADASHPRVCLPRASCPSDVCSASCTSIPSYWYRDCLRHRVLPKHPRYAAVAHHTGCNSQFIVVASTGGDEPDVAEATTPGIVDPGSQEDRYGNIADRFEFFFLIWSRYNTGFDSKSDFRYQASSSSNIWGLPVLFFDGSHSS